VTRLGITSVSNARLKTIRRLRRRGGSGVFLVEGYRGLLHALDSGAPIREVYAAVPLFLGTEERRLVDRAEASGALVVELGADAFHSISGRPRPDGLLAVVERFATSLETLRLPHDPLLLVAESIERPGNLGTIVRTACGAAADAVIVCDGPTGVFHPDTIQGSVGAVFRVPLAEASAESAISWLRTHGMRTLVASPQAERRYWDVDCSGPLALVVGSERHGVSELFLGAADEVVQIPMGGGVDSLNVAVAAGIVLFEAARQRADATTRAAGSGRAERARLTAASRSPGWNGFRTSSAPPNEPSVSGA
jgi:TrmH family RNA methyltransferase